MAALSMVLTTRSLWPLIEGAAELGMVNFHTVMDHMKYEIEAIYHIILNLIAGTWTMNPLRMI